MDRELLLNIGQPKYHFAGLNVNQYDGFNLI